MGDSPTFQSGFRFRVSGFSASTDGTNTEVSAYDMAGEGYSSSDGSGSPFMRGGGGRPFFPRMPRFGDGGRAGRGGEGGGGEDPIQQLMDMLLGRGMGPETGGAGGAGGAGGDKDNLKALEDLLINFEQYDKNKNGALDENEIQANDGNRRTQRGRQAVGAQTDELMFASVDQIADTEKPPTPRNWAAAWTGLTRQDLTRLIAQVKGGKNLNQIGGELRNKIGAERGVDSSPGGFRAYVRGMQESLRNRGLI